MEIVENKTRWDPEAHFIYSVDERPYELCALFLAVACTTCSYKFPVIGIPQLPSATSSTVLAQRY